MTDFETKDDLHSFFAEMQDVKPIKPSNKALLHDTEKAIAEKRGALQVNAVKGKS